MRRSIGALLGALLGAPAMSGVVACGSAPEATAPVATARVAPPRPGPAPAWQFPAVATARLENGLELRVVERGRLPLVEIRLLVLSGSASDGPHPGAAALTAQLLKAPASPAARPTRPEPVVALEALGATISATTTRDATSLSLTVEEAYLDTAVQLLAELATRPQLDAETFERVRAHEMERVLGLARTSADWAASMALYRQLFRLGDKQHPYARHEATASELEALSLEHCQSWHAGHFSPRNTFIAVVGNTTLTRVKHATQLGFGRWQGDEVSPPVFFSPALPGRFKIWLVHRPESEHSQIRIATLGPERQSSLWPRARLASQILGGPGQGRLARDLGQTRHLAFETGARLEEVAYGPSPVVLTVSARTETTAPALAALLEQFERMATTRPSNDEVALWSRFLADDLLLGFETTGSTADLASRLGLFALSDGYYRHYRSTMLQLTVTEVEATASQLFDRSQAVVVVAGDARRLERPLSRFGQVHTLIPEDDFRVDRVVTHDPELVLDGVDTLR